MANRWTDPFSARTELEATFDKYFTTERQPGGGQPLSLDDHLHSLRTMERFETGKVEKFMAVFADCLTPESASDEDREGIRDYVQALRDFNRQFPRG